MAYPMMAGRPMGPQGGRGGRGGMPQPMPGMPQNMVMMNGVRSGGRGQGGRGGRGQGGGRGGPQLQAGRGGPGQGRGAQPQAAKPAAPAAPAQASSGVLPSAEGGDRLTTAILANASPEQQKQMLGERLFPQVMAMQPELAGKITGMLLEMDNTELLVLLESAEQLKAKVVEAIEVLKQHGAIPESAGAEAAE